MVVVVKMQEEQKFWSNSFFMKTWYGDNSVAFIMHK